MPGTPLTRFVFLGPEGTFSEQALLTLPEARDGIRVPVRSVPEALDAVRRGDADGALVPVENSIGGQVGVTLDELVAGGPLMIAREVVIPVEFVLAAASPVDLSAIRSVAAHPQASTQCRHWLRAHLPNATVVDVLSNAAAAIAAAQGEHDAAICVPLGAGRYALTTLADKIADHRDAVTRFALVCQPGPPPVPTGNDVTSLAIYIAHDRVGALLAVLMELAVRGINLSRIESYPTGEQLGRYVFFLDCAGHVAQARMGEALQGLRRICPEVRFLGSYPRAQGTEGAGSPGSVPDDLDHPGSVSGSPGSAGRPGSAPGPGAASGNADVEFAESAAWLARLRSGELS